jgi:hypothetical protein
MPPMIALMPQTRTTSAFAAGSVSSPRVPETPQQRCSRSTERLYGGVREVQRIGGGGEG